MVLLISLPATFAFLMLAIPFLSTLFQHGGFKEHDVLMSASSLCMFALGIPGFMLIKVLASGFYARQNIKKPVKIAVVAMVANTLMSVALIFPMAHAGLALSTSISSTLNAGMLFYGLVKAGFYQPGSHWRRFGLQMLAANSVMCVLLWIFNDAPEVWFAASNQWRGLHLTGLCVLAMVSYFIVLWALGLRPKDFIFLESSSKDSKEAASSL
jgi:putative peptidoglycan lipid II flippase